MIDGHLLSDVQGHDRSTLAALEISSRIGRLREVLSESGCSGLLVTKIENIRYLTGFTGSAAMLFISSTASMAVTDGRYRDQIVDQLAAGGVDAEIVVGRPDDQQAALKRVTAGEAKIGLEAAGITWAGQMRVAGYLEAELVATTGLVEQLRIVKDTGELQRIEQACNIADVALAQVKERLTEGLTEAEFAAELEFEMRRRGSDGPSFETIVASGPNSAMPHARPTGRRMDEGDLVVIDFGATVDGYHSDMTRTFALGRIDGRLQELIDAVSASQRAGLAAVGPTASGASVDAASRESLAAVGLGELFLHSTGHGVGLEIHEAPAVAPGATDNLPVGAVVTVEPGAYLAGRGGVRIEDTVVVTERGSRPLTKSTKDYLL
jgi:Xaa-Pro aminopeptidase